MFDWLNMPAARGQIMDVIKNSFPELEEKYEKLSDEFWLEKRKEIVQLGKKYKKPIKICFGSVGLLKFG
jgi:acyl carrier protein phosphodiesterase